MASNDLNQTQHPLLKQASCIQEALHLLETFEESLYELLDQQPLELSLHVSLALVASAIDLLTHLLNILSTINS